MRARLLILALGAAVAAAPGDTEGTVRDEERNFEISLPEDSVDWLKKPIPEDDKFTRALIYTEFASDEGASWAAVRVRCYLMNRKLAKKKLDWIAEHWSETFTGYLGEPHERKVQETTIGKGAVKAPAVRVDVKGAFGPAVDQHHVTLFFTRMGKYLYVVSVERANKAIGDDLVQEEVQAMLDSFAFLREEKVEYDRKGSDEPPEVRGGKPRAGDAGGGGPEHDKADLAPKRYGGKGTTLHFWRFKCLKPQGLAERTITPEQETQHVKLAFEGKAADNTTIYIYVYAETLGAQAYTMEQYADAAEKVFKERSKASKEPKRQPDYPFPHPAARSRLAKKTLSLEMIGRRTSVVRESWYYAECRNDRFYRLMILMYGSTAPKTWKRQIEQFLKSFQPYK